MKNNNYIFSLLTLILLSLAGCSKNNDEKLRVLDVENNTLTLHYPVSTDRSITISGGTTPYKAKCVSDVLKVNTTEWPNAFKLEALGLGEAKVEISDASRQSLTLNVVIQNYELDFVITAHDAVVKGELTSAEQNEVKTKVLSTIQVKKGGGYKFIYKESKEGEETGTVRMYPESFGEGDNYREGSFMIEYPQNAPGRYILTFEDAQHIFRLDTYNPAARSSETRPVAFYEELTEKYKADYPNVEQVYSVQIFEFTGGDIYSR